MIGNLVSISQILNIDNVILENSKKFEQENELILKCIYDQYDLLAYKKKFLILFSEIRMVYNYNYAFKNNELKVTANYDTEVVDNRNLSNPVAKYIESIVDDQIKITKLYFEVIKLSYKFTLEESIYFINTFLKQKTEIEIAKIFGVTKPSIDQYKKSCLFKMMINLSEFIEESNDY